MTDDRDDGLFAMGEPGQMMYFARNPWPPVTIKEPTRLERLAEIPRRIKRATLAAWSELKGEDWE